MKIVEKLISNVMSQSYKCRQTGDHCILSSALGVLLMLLLLFTVVAYQQSITTLADNYTMLQEQNREREWFFVKSLIKENRDKAQLMADLTAGQITEDLTRQYYSGSPDSLKNDINHIMPTSYFVQSLESRVRDKYMNGVRNDNNDPFIARRDGIIFDKSTNCGGGSDIEVRSWDQEIAMHTNKELARSAIDSIKNPRANREIFWEFLPSSNPDHIKIVRMEYDSLKDVYMQEGLAGLVTYEFLSVSYITERGDLFGVEDVDAVGRAQFNNKLIVVQGFSLTDAIQKAGYASYFEQNRKDLLAVKREMEYKRSIMFVCLVFSMIIILAVFLGINNYVNGVIGRVKKSYLQFDDQCKH